MKLVLEQYLLCFLSADVDACDRYDITPLHMAAEGGHFECLQLLLDAGANCNVPTKFARYVSLPGIKLASSNPMQKKWVCKISGKVLNLNVTK